MSDATVALERAREELSLCDVEYVDDDSIVGDTAVVGPALQLVRLRGISPFLETSTPFAGQTFANIV